VNITWVRVRQTPQAPLLPITHIYVQLWKVVDSNARVAVVVATAVRQPGGGSEPSAELEELGLARPELG